MVAAFPAIGQKSRLVDRVVEEIQEQILTGRLAPGTRLPPERDLAAQLCVSRTVLREATRVLAARGLLETLHGAGTTVRPMNLDRITESFKLILQSQGITLDDIHQVRSILEVEIAGLAAQSASEADLAALTDLARQMEEAENQPEVLARVDTGFHQLLASLSGNPLLAVLLESFSNLMSEVRLVVQNHPALRETVLPDHRRIIACIARHDPEGARAAMQVHLDHARAIQEEALARSSKHQHDVVKSLDLS
ncbi:MAG: FadR family transcriptional regulator [Anaerolineales bacterium]|nr:FadR family transcriptional regulator [Anaerolineales bacterium]